MVCLWKGCAKKAAGDFGLFFLLDDLSCPRRGDSDDDDDGFDDDDGLWGDGSLIVCQKGRSESAILHLTRVWRVWYAHSGLNREKKL